MKIGCCANIEQANILYEAGFDFIECPVISLIPEESDEQFRTVLQQYERSPLPVECFNILLSGDLTIVGEEVDKERIRNYLNVAFSRVKQIGADTVVFGSGGARSFPVGFPREKAKKQIIDFLILAAQYAEPLGIIIVIEPLNQKESNMINSLPEAIQFAEAVNSSSVKVLADFYHMVEEKEPLKNIVSSKNYLKHVHVADTDRLAPGTGNYPYEEFVNCIKQSNYEGRISIECHWNDFENEIFQAYHFLQSVFLDS